MAAAAKTNNVWVLDTETKGTGAHIAPLEQTGGSRPRERALALVELARPPRDLAPTPAPTSMRFRVRDVMTSRTIADEVDAAGAVAALEQLRSIVDAEVFVSDPESGRWRLLSQEDRRRLWQLRDRVVHARSGATSDRDEG
jgi:hypothetical protein